MEKQGRKKRNVLTGSAARGEAGQVKNVRKVESCLTRRLNGQKLKF